MGEKTTSDMGRFGARRSRLLTGGTTGFVAAVTLLMVLSPAGAAAHPNTVLKAPYKGTVSAPNYGTSIYGCGTAKTTMPKWSGTTGIATGMDSATAKPCAKSLGYTGTSSNGQSNGGISVAVPFLVATSGNHSVAMTFALTLATTATFTMGGCPAKNVNYHPSTGSSSFAECFAGALVILELSGSVQDLNNGSWYGNYSFGFADHSLGWENYTDCYNYGTPTCYNHTGSSSYNYSFGYNQAGFGTVNWTGGPATVVLYTNGTNMVRGHHYVANFQVYTDFIAETSTYFLKAPWAASSVGSLNWGTLGNGAKLSSITIV